MRTIVFIVSLVLATFLVAGCTDNTADDRLRKVLQIPASHELTEPLVHEKVAALLPLGTPEPLMAEKLKASGIGKSPLSSYNLNTDGSMAVVRVEFDPSTFAFAQEAWIISLHLDSFHKLKAIQVKRHLTGL